MDKAKIVQNLNALFKQRAEFYSYFDENMPKSIILKYLILRMLKI